MENDFTPTSKTATMSVICIPDTSLQSHDSGFVETKLCKAIEKCTGPIDELRKLDLLRKLLKDRKHKRQQLKIEDINTYQHLLSQLKMTIIKKKREYNVSIKTYEQNFYIQQGRVPTGEKDSSVWAEMMRKKIYATKLLETWDTAV